MSSKIKTLIWGFTNDMSPVVKYLQDWNICDVKVWVGAGKDGHYSRSAFMQRKFQYDSPMLCDEITYDRVFAHFHTYLVQVNAKNQFNQADIFELQNLFNRQLNFFYWQLTSQEIKLVLFPRPPHYGPDTILYHLAKALGLKTIILYPSLFKDRFYYCYDMQDYGYFREIPQLQPLPEYTLERKFKKDLPYTIGWKPYNYSLRQALEDFKSGKSNAFTKYQNCKKFKSNLKKSYEQYCTTNLNVPFVYFPLMFQPEMSTSAVGGKYTDQVLALERLSRKLPDGWWIYIKERHFQTEFMRDGNYFDRLWAIPNLRFVPLGTNTYDLIEKCRFVATITGTAGYEAVTGGKNALVFGQPWYLTIPGVFQYDDNFTVDHILNERPTREEQEYGIRILLSKTREGTMAHQFFDTKSYFNAEENGEKLARFYRDEVERLFATAPQLSVLPNQ